MTDSESALEAESDEKDSMVEGPSALVIQERGAVAGSGGMAGPPCDEELERVWALPPGQWWGHVWGRRGF